MSTLFSGLKNSGRIINSPIITDCYSQNARFYSLTATNVNIETITINTLDVKNISASSIYTDSLVAKSGSIQNLSVDNATITSAVINTLTATTIFALFITATTVANLNVVAPIINMGVGNGSIGDTLNEGFTVEYKASGAPAWGSLLRYPTTKIWYLSQDTTPMPDSSSDPSTFTPASLNVDTLYGNNVNVTDGIFTNISATNILDSYLLSTTITATDLFVNNSIINNSTFVNISATNILDSYLSTKTITATTIFGGTATINDISCASISAINILDSYLTTSVITATSAFIGTATITNTFFNNISATNILDTYLTTSVITATTAFVGTSTLMNTSATNVVNQFLSSAVITATNLFIGTATITTTVFNNISATNVLTSFLKSSVITATTEFVGTGTVTTLFADTITAGTSTLGNVSNTKFLATTTTFNDTTDLTKILKYDLSSGITGKTITIASAQSDNVQVVIPNMLGVNSRFIMDNGIQAVHSALYDDLAFYAPIFDCDTGTVAFGNANATGITIGKSGIVTNINSTNLMPNQSCFSVYLSGALSNVTGDGTVYSIPFDTAFYNVGSNYTLSATPGSSLYTAPQTGKYQFSASYNLTGITSGHDQMNLILNVGGTQYTLKSLNPFAIQAHPPGGTLIEDYTLDISLTTGTVVQCVVVVFFGTKVIGLGANSGISGCRFQGRLMG